MEVSLDRRVRVRLCVCRARGLLLTLSNPCSHLEPSFHLALPLARATSTSPIITQGIRPPPLLLPPPNPPSILIQQHDARVTSGLRSQSAPSTLRLEPVDELSLTGLEHSELHCRLSAAVAGIGCGNAPRYASPSVCAVL